jgi:predicted MFS family arabinose efflux permease
VTSASRFRAACYAVEGLNSFAVVIYFNYLYFYFRDTFGFSDRQNLELAAFLGVTYIFASLWAGKIARRIGYFPALKIGFAVMAAGLLAGVQLHSISGAVAAACVVNFGMCFIWPVLEALVSEGSHAARAVGLYNITWATTNASAFFLGGTLIEKLGYQSIFFVPLGFMVLQFLMIFWLEKMWPQRSGKGVPPDQSKGVSPLMAQHERDACPTAPALVKNFQRLAWLANPFAYIAINTLIAVLPGLAHKFNLSPMFAGFACSLWCFARVGAFVVLWKWSGWHYRFGWLATAFALMVVSFAVILISPSLAVIFAAQIIFGATAGLMYYSSLFYAMDAHDSSSEHGGIHEAAIGLGNFLGPAAGAAALWLAPQSPLAGAWTVTGLLAFGFGGLLWVRKKS